MPSGAAMGVKRPAKPSKDETHGYLAAGQPDKYRRMLDNWAAFVANRMTVKEMTAWLDGNKWGGSNPYLKTSPPWLNESKKNHYARVIAQMILVDDTSYQEPKELS